ncbi:MAG TPA: hypothetical protein VFN73_01515 [Propionibacteriaceae bacterium]|nr:hypothetical protein [Propionibacteriaceae bacterium]
MNKSVYSTLLKIVGVVALVAGIAITYAGTWAHGFVSDQLSSQKITMPSGAALTEQVMKDHLTKYAGQAMTTGPQAYAYSEYFIHEHMMAASGGKSYSEIGAEASAMAAANPKLTAGTASATDMAAYQKLTGIKNTLFQGDALRSMLLTAYAWWTIGTIALWVGIILIVAGVVLAALGFVKLGGKATGAPAAA